MRRTLLNALLAVALIMSNSFGVSAQKMEKNARVSVVKPMLENSMMRCYGRPLVMSNEPSTRSLDGSDNTLPYLQDFEAANVDASTKFIKGWTKGSLAWVGSFNNTTAFSGSTNMGWNFDQAGDTRNEWVITNAFHLENSKKVEISFRLYMPGYSTGTDKLTFGVNTTQSSTGVTTLVTVDEAISSWTEITASFTPSTTGDYYFTWNITGNNNGAGVDAFKVGLEGTAWPLTPSIVYHCDKQLWGGFTGAHYLMPSQNTSFYATWLEGGSAYIGWTIDGTPVQSEEDGSLIAALGTTAKHTVELSLGLPEDQSITSTTSRIINSVLYTDAIDETKEGQLFYTSNYYEQADPWPAAWPASNRAAAIPGFNEYSSSLAQKFDLVQGVTMKIAAIYFDVYDIGFTSKTSPFATSSISYKLLGVKADGTPDESRVLAQASGKLIDIYDQIMEHQNKYPDENPLYNLIQFNAAVTVSEPFFVVLDAQIPSDYDSATSKEGVLLNAFNENIFDGSTPMYVKYEDSWSDLSELGADYLSGYSLGVGVLGMISDVDLTSINTTSSDSEVLAFIANDQLVVKTSEGALVNVYSVDGKLALSETYLGQPISVATLANGIYVVKVGEKSFKVVK